MPHIHSKSSRPATAALVLVLASLVLAACGGSSSTTKTTTAATSASATTPTTGTTSKGRFPAGRFLALRECLKKNGITLPSRTPGQAPSPGAGGLLGGANGPALPKGVTKAQYEAVLKKCGGGLRRGGFGGVKSRLSTPEAKKALAKFAACMRENGIKIGEPNTSGKGAIFNTKGINTTTAQFATAETKCRSNLRGAFGARPGAGSGESPPSSTG
ncbi:MAG: hypothetical protein ABSB69_18615 [Solirubrobacteraceae bacterium]|jgi:hypothetical protein